MVGIIDSKFNNIDNLKVINGKFNEIDKQLNRNNRISLNWSNHMQIDTFKYGDDTVWTNYLEDGGIVAVIFRREGELYDNN